MQIRKLEPLFYQENTRLVEVLDKDQNGVWLPGKERGYGIVICEYDGLRFGIPLRSHVRHNSGLRTVGEKGLDYGKVVLLIKDACISALAFKIPDAEHRILQAKTKVILHQFSKYVANYIRGCKRNDANILRGYKYSTLQNYHAELCIGCCSR